MALNTRTFTDIDLTFDPHPNTGDLVVKRNENAIKNSIKNLVMTRHYERLFHSEKGSNAFNMLFELDTPATASILKREILDVIQNYEPRVIITAGDIVVQFTTENGMRGIRIIMEFTIINTVEPIPFEFFIRRVR